ncbi:hypothetical protein GCM10010243_43880 [Streptomyces matensis]|nr:hypothetical protein GCM10010243_43880 [Streptomyces matensis]
MIAAAAADRPNRGRSRSASCSTRVAKTDKGEPSGGLVVPGVPARRTAGRDGDGGHDDPRAGRAEGTWEERPAEVPYAAVAGRA